MKIPIRNLYYLFLYAWGRFPGGALTNTGIDDSPDLPNLLARLLSSETRRLFRRGLDRGYRTASEELVSPRGRLRLDRMVKQITQLRGTAVCDFDELSHDVLHNQILKATIANLARCEQVERAIRHELRGLARRFHGVSDIRLSNQCFRQVLTSRNNREYVFLMRLCEFLFWALMPDEAGATARFKKILEDETRMSAVFEEFLRNFYLLHRREYRVRAESTEWDVSDTSDADRVLLPRMLTDITLRNAHRTIIIDAKFYGRALALGPHGEKVRSNHLYQLVTYLQHERARASAVPLVGLLLYPDIGRSLRLQYRLLGLPVTVATVNLDAEWRNIEIELNVLLEDLALAAGAKRNSEAVAC